MLMAIEFPWDLVVADRGEFKKGNPEPRIERRPIAVNDVEMPIDFLSVIKGVIAEETETMAANLVGFPQNFSYNVGQMLAQQVDALRQVTAGKKELARWCRGTHGQSQCAAWNAEPMLEQIALFVESLLRAQPHLFPIHAGDTAQFIFPSGGHG